MNVSDTSGLARLGGACTTGIRNSSPGYCSSVDGTPNTQCKRVNGGGVKKGFKAAAGIGCALGVASVPYVGGPLCAYVGVIAGDSDLDEDT